ncbi:MAG: plasmid stabilization protein [Propionibacteriaceae bacterium]|jgi:plasmid stability protein|nr:plasmid stabilization protein [Propionibacteriaceae bacterium]
MASVITVRNLDPEAKQRIKRRAAAHDRSMEAEIRAILEAVPEPDPEPAIIRAIRLARQEMGDGGWDLPPRNQEQQREVRFP